jgi:hypothetical protein
MTTIKVSYKIDGEVEVNIPDEIIDAMIERNELRRSCKELQAFKEATREAFNQLNFEILTAGVYREDNRNPSTAWIDGEDSPMPRGVNLS